VSALAYRLLQGLGLMLIVYLPGSICIVLPHKPEKIAGTFYHGRIGQSLHRPRTSYFQFGPLYLSRTYGSPGWAGEQ
jgi:hypothetical protein